MLLAEPTQSGFDVGLLVGKRLGVSAYRRGMQALDVELHGGPAGRQDLDGLVERLGDLPQSGDPLRPLLRRQVRCPSIARIASAKEGSMRVGLSIWEGVLGGD